MPVKDASAITVVSGLPRSGTSMMMRMLDKGGLPPLTDAVRKPDEDNPWGYYEFERAKELARDSSWLDQALGKAVKIVSPLLEHLPQDRLYRIVFMRRDMTEILASQRLMLRHRGQATGETSDPRMSDLFRKHLAHIEQEIARRDSMESLFVSYKEVLSHPAKQAARVCEFLGGGLDVEAMAKAVEPALYRHRGQAI